MRFSLKWMLATVAFVGFACVALWDANETWAMAAMGVTLTVLLVALVGAVHSKGFYAGMAVFGWAYLFLTYAPLRGSTRPLAAIDDLLDTICDRIARDIPVSPNALRSEHERQLSAAERTVLKQRQKTASESSQKAPDSARISVNIGPTGYVYQLPIPTHFLTVGRSLLALVFGAIGGVIGQCFARAKRD